MLMLRQNVLAGRIEDSEELKLSAEPFRLIDNSPECILSSIEVKYDVVTDRSKMFGALAEAAANSRWANESWLVFMDPKPSEILPDIIPLARSIEVGILEVRISRDSRENARVLELKVHCEAPIRSALRFSELGDDRDSVLKEVDELLKDWQGEEPTFLDADGAPAKAVRLLQQAFVNVRNQSGCLDNAKQISPSDDVQADLSEFTQQLFASILPTAALAAELAPIHDAAPAIQKEVKNILTHNDSEEFAKNLNGILYPSIGGSKAHAG